MNNPDKFDYYCGVLFAKLYESFPVAISTADIDEFEDEEDFQIIVATLTWLQKNGLIDGEFVMAGTMYNVTPTLHGLSLLKMLPASLESKESIGEALAGAVKNKTPDLVIELVKTLFTSS